MKKRTADILLGVVLSSAVLLAGCGQNEATEAANESVETEKEGKGDSEELKEEKKEEAEAETEETEEEPALKVGVLFPEELPKGQRELAQKEMEQQLEDVGYDAEIFYAEGNADKQIAQIRELVQAEAAALIIDPVDEYGLSEVLEETKEASIPVFSYNRLIMNTDAVKYYVTFDAREIGHKIAENIVKVKDLKKARESKQSYTIELFMGSPDDIGALFVYNGMMEILQEYFDDGTLVCKSQKMSFDDTSVMRWSTEAAKADFKEITAEFYAEEGTPDIICTAYDGFARGILEELESAGRTPLDENWPMVTGIGAEAESVKSVAEGKQSFTMFADGRELAEACVKMVDTYLKGDKPEVEDYEQYDNGKKIIGTVTCEAKLIDGDNYQILADNGFYPEEVIKPDAQTAQIRAVREAPEEETEEETAAVSAEEPEVTPTEEPKVTPTEEPEATPTEVPEAAPTEEPEVTPTEEPEATPTQAPAEKEADSSKASKGK